MRRKLFWQMASSGMTGWLLLGLGSFSWAHQPVMDMAPRWEKGYGVQVRHEWRGSDKVKEGDSAADNPLGRDKRVNTTWLEGVYTFRREARVTLKLPLIHQSRTIAQNGQAVRQTGNGVGDLILAVPLKLYENKGRVTHNIGVTPSIRLPTGSTSDSFPTGDGSTDLGFSVSYNTEDPFFYQFYELFYWNNTRGRKGIAPGDEVGLDVNVGIHPLHNNETNSGIFLMWDVSTRYKDRGRDGGGDTGGTRISTGPIFVWYRNNVMFRAEFKFPAYENVHGSQVSRGLETNVGIGITF